MARVHDDAEDPLGVAEGAPSQQDVLAAQNRLLVLSVIGTFEVIDLVVRLLALELA